MRRLLWLALAAGAACSQVSKVDPAPTNVFYRPGGIGVFSRAPDAGTLIVASTNSDLLYDAATGGSVITVDPTSGDAQFPKWIGGLRIESFAGQMAIADSAERPGRDEPCEGVAPLALVPARGADVLYKIALGGADGAPSCDGCGVPLSGSGHYADAYTVAVACAKATPTAPAAMARAYVGYLRGEGNAAWVSEIDLLDPGAPPRSNSYGNGQMLGFAFDAGRRRLYAAQAGLGLRWIDLVGDCRLDVNGVDGGCRSGFAPLPLGMDAHALALSRPDLPGPRRLYILARVLDTRAGSSSGVATFDVDGVLLVTELVEDLYGGMTLELVEPPISVGYGPVALAILPGRAGTGKRDVVAALASDDGVLVLYDDDDGAQVVIGRDTRDTATHAATGHPWLGRQPFGLAVDPATIGGSAVVYVGSWAESTVTRLLVPMADITTMQLPPEFAFTQIKGGR